MKAGDNMEAEGQGQGRGQGRGQVQGQQQQQQRKELNFCSGLVVAFCVLVVSLVALWHFFFSIPPFKKKKNIFAHHNLCTCTCHYFLPHPQRFLATGKITSSLFFTKPELPEVAERKIFCILSAVRGVAGLAVHLLRADGLQQDAR